MKIITISREFGSGGREIGKRLADALGVPCYDHEIIDMVAEQHGFDKNYVAHISEKDIRVFYPSTIAHRFMAHQPAAQQPIKNCSGRTRADPAVGSAGRLCHRWPLRRCGLPEYASVQYFCLRRSDIQAAAM